MPEPKTLRDLRRAQIVAEARALVSEEGLEGLTIGALEKRLEFTRGVITYHFENKEEILEEVLASAVREIGQAVESRIEAGAGLEGKIRAMLRGTVEGYLGHPEAAYVLFRFWSRFPRDERAARKNRELYASYRAHAARVLAGERLPRDVDLDHLAALLVGVVIGVVTQFYFEPGAIDPYAVADEAARAILARLGGRRIGQAKRAASRPASEGP